MQIPPDKNTRAEAMWRIISQRVDFRGKRVQDLGCGTGDFLWRAVVAGAEWIMGVDLELHFDFEAFNYGSHNGILYSNGDINKLRKARIYGDIAFCFSVLPYLDDVPKTLKWMASNFSTCLIECQYAGDGPGLTNIGADKGMLQLLLSNGFDSAEALGRTYPDRKFPNGEPVYRTIWLCETKE